ncbi:helix-turn-helix domain-containing protein [Natroniella sp. ANB-PHB2]|uniref:helix-turn-helix domain-containing protein n=1 Tax=Natroniella sp. ANB-PHB2 TaxID=3384444 RepID=UPI0038D3DFE3
MPEFVKKLKDRREELEISLKKAENVTKIRRTYLKAIEEGKFGKIDQETHIRGFLKVYSSYLGLDQQEILASYDDFKKELKGEVEQEVTFKDKLIDQADQNQNKLLVLTLVICGLLVVGALGFVGSRVYYLIDNEEGDFDFQPIQKIQEVITNLEGELEEEEPIEDLNDDISTTEGVMELEEAEIDSFEEDKITVEKELNQTEVLELVVETIEDTWYQVTVDGEEVFEGFTVAKEVHSFAGREIEMRIGNAAGVVVIKDGERYGPFGNEGEVITQIFSAMEDEQE